jgi:hypothetical protein
MKKNLLILVALAIVLTAPQLASAATDPEVEQEITKLREGLVDSFNHGDMAERRSV